MATQGNWQGNYGFDGENVIGSGTTNYPAYALVTVTGNITTTTWSASTTDVRALEQPSGTGRVAAAWQSGTSFTINVDMTDTRVHEVSLYLVDLTDNGRSESIEVLNADNGAVLSLAQTVSNFAGGEYLTWNLKGNVEFVITEITGPTAVVSGIFFGGATPTANYLATDVTTQGNWQGNYGVDGENVIGSGTTNYPAYAQVNVTGNTTTTTWAASTTDVRALQQPSGSGRVAAAWQSTTSFTIDVDLTILSSHEVSLYLVDFDDNGRTESIEVLNAENGAVLCSPRPCRISRAEST